MGDMNEALKAIQEAIDPEEVFKPASEEELEGRPVNPDRVHTDLLEDADGNSYEMRTNDSTSSWTFHVNNDLLARGGFGGPGITTAQFPEGGELGIMEFISNMMFEHGQHFPAGA